MKNLTLLRHAKSSWANPDQSDHDRPLNSRGELNIPDMAKRMLERGCTPDLILCSSATRTQQTARMFMVVHALSDDILQVHDDLYLASAGTLLDFVQQTPDNTNHVMIIAHNPGLEVLGKQLHAGAPAQLPTCAVLHYALHSDNYQIQPDTEIELVFYDYPKNTSN